MQNNRRRNIGEITGESLVTQDMLMGMPFRSSYSNSNVKKNDDYEKMLKTRNDFEVFDPVDSDELDNKIDGIGGSGSGNMGVFENNNNNNNSIKDKQIYQNIDYLIGDYMWYFYPRAAKYMRNSCVLNLSSLISLFGVIFLGSKNDTAIELRNYFNFYDKNSIYSSLKRLSMYLNNSEMRIGNYLIYSDKMIPDTNDQFLKYIGNLNILNMINKNDVSYQALNNMLMTKYKLDSSPFRIEHFMKIKLSLMSFGYYEPQWNFCLNKLMKGNFYGTKKTPEQKIYFVAENQYFPYHEDEMFQIIELPTQNKTAFGIIKPLEGNIGQLDFETVSLLVNNLKPVYMREVVFPEVEIETKLRYNDLLKLSGLEKIFEELEFTELTGMSSTPLQVFDVIQNFHIKFTRTCIKPHKLPVPENVRKTNINFICNKSFIFYVRDPRTNIFFLCGHYY